MSNDYSYCPICGEKTENWSGFWPDHVFNVRRTSIKCPSCGFSGELVVKTGESEVPKVNIDSLRDNVE